MRLLVVALLVGPLVTGCAAPEEERPQPVPAESASQTQADVQESDTRSQSLGRLLDDLVQAYEEPSESSEQVIETDLEAVRASDEQSYAVAQRVADTWAEVYLDADYPLYEYQSEYQATGLWEAGLPDSASHAFVVLGYELENGEMTDELRGRCEAAAAAARVYPNALLICTGGATGKNNPEHHTEAGLMKSYLVEVCGIDEGRVLADEAATSTVQNAQNCLDIMRQHGVTSMTLITSEYHQRWSQAVFGAARAVFEMSTGYVVGNMGNYNYVCEPSEEVYLQDDRIAAMQVASMLGVEQQDLSVRPNAS